MNFRSQIKPAVTFEPIAFADIVINLFVFFFLCFGLLATFGTGKKGLLPVQLPEGGEAYSNRFQTSPLVVTVHPAGALFMGRKAIPFDQLTRTVNHELKERPSKQVVLEPDQTLTLERFVPILDELRRSDAEAILIATTVPEHSRR